MISTPAPLSLTLPSLHTCCPQGARFFASPSYAELAYAHRAGGSLLSDWTGLNQWSVCYDKTIHSAHVAAIHSACDGNKHALVCMSTVTAFAG